MPRLHAGQVVTVEAGPLGTAIGVVIRWNGQRVAVRFDSGGWLLVPRAWVRPVAH